MASLKILVPDGTTNYVKNPAMRYSADTSAYVAIGSTITRSLERARFGIASLKVVTNGSVLHEGASYRISWLAGMQSSLTASVYLRGGGKVRLRFADNLTGNNYISKPVSLTDNRWTRLSVSGRCNGGNDIRIYVETDDNTPKAITFYADGFQMEPKDYVTTYCDGDQPGCTWAIYQHGSISTRSPYTRAGGRFVELAGCERDVQDIYMTVIGGLGVAPIQNNIQPFANAPGSYYENTKTMDRVITITFHAKAPDLRGTAEKSLRKLHALRRMLYDIIRPDKTTGGEEFVIEYQDGDFPVYCKVRYESGLEGEWDVRNRFTQSFPIRFLAVSPYLYDDNYETFSLNFRERKTVNYAMQRLDGTWGGMNGGMNALIRDILIGKRGEVIACGSFNLSNNLATATDPMIHSNCVAYWDGIQWHALGSGVGTGSIIYSIAIAPNGDIYAVGDFTTIGGVAANRIAKWNGSAWSALGTGLNATAYAVKVAPNGDVYAGGTFTTAGGTTAGYCARWDGSMWHNMGTYLGLNNSVYSIAISNDGTQVFLGGAFTDERTSPAISPPLYVALYEVAFNQFFVLGDGFNNTVRKLVLSPSQRLYACGDFTQSGTQTMLYVSYFNGSAWYDIAAGADNVVRFLDVDAQGNILAAGDFARIGSEDANGVALYNGSTWVNLDVELAAACYAAKWDSAGNIFISPNATLADMASINTVTVLGTAETSPLVYIVGPCTLRWLENQTTKKRLYADLDILNGEEVLINFANGKVESTVRGDIAYAISPGSDLKAWTLLPGENKIVAMMANDISATLRMYYAPRHWSADAMVDERGF